MKTVLTILAFILFLAPAAAQEKIPMQAFAWELNGNKAKFITHLGQQTLRIDDGGQAATGSNIVMVKDLDFTNGTIEYDAALADNTRFTSIHFRRKDAANSEHFYLRANAVDDPNVNSAVQYAAVLNGVNLWDLSNEYQSNASIKNKGWNHIKLVVRDGQLLAYVNDMVTPALYVPMMDGDWASGGVGFDGNVYLTNLTVTPDATDGLHPGNGIDPVHNDARYLRSWQVTEPIDLPYGTEPTALPKETITWSAISAERLGMVNLSRKFGATPRGTRRMVWLKTTIKAKEAMQRHLDFGFSDEVYVYLNGKPIGVTNFFFGWGVVARLNDGGGLRY